MPVVQLTELVETEGLYQNTFPNEVSSPTMLPAGAVFATIALYFAKHVVLPQLPLGTTVLT